MEKNVKAERNKYRMGVFYLIIDVKTKLVNFKDDKYGQSKTANFGVNCCNTKPKFFYVLCP